MKYYNKKRNIIIYKKCCHRACCSPPGGFSETLKSCFDSNSPSQTRHLHTSVLPFTLAWAASSACSNCSSVCFPVAVRCCREAGAACGDHLAMSSMSCDGGRKNGDEEKD